jgi:hypothetical protein
MRPIGNCWLYGSSRLGAYGGLQWQDGLYNHLDKDEMSQIWTVCSSYFFSMWRGSSGCPTSERKYKGLARLTFDFRWRDDSSRLPRMQGWAFGVSPHNGDLVHHSTWCSMRITSLFLLVSRRLRPCFLDLAAATWSLRIRIDVWFQW